MAEPTVNEPDIVESYSGEPTRSKLIQIHATFSLSGSSASAVRSFISMMEDDLIGEDSREWTDESIFMGWIRAGNPGAIVAGFFFMLPTFIIVVFFSWLYFAYQ